MMVFLISSSQLMNLGNPSDINGSDEDPINTDDLNSLDTSALNLTDPITGKGVNQTHRVYMENQSETLNNHGYFNISSPTDHSYLDYGNFNFTFQNNYTTNHSMEDQAALNDNHTLNDYVAFEMNTGLSQLTELDAGTITNLDDLTNEDPTDYVEIIDSDDKEINLTLQANYTNQNFDTGNGILRFNDSKVLGFLIRLNMTVDLSSGANLTMFAKNLKTDSWERISDKISVNGNKNFHLIKKSLINKNFSFIDSTNQSNFRFNITNDANPFELRIREFDVNPIYGFELPITSFNQTALEFDLKGENTTVNGAYAWIRTLDPVNAPDTNLTFSLYRASGTTDRNDLLTSTIEPSTLIDSVNITGFSGDGLVPIEFDTTLTANLSLGNYFIVIKSNRTEEVYSLVCIPSNEFGDGQLDHILKKSIDGGANWKTNQETTININGYTSDPLDASGFKLNITRGYMPSDFEVDDNTLNIQDVPLQNRIIQQSGKSDLTWGLGQWDNDFPNTIENTAQNNFQIELNWSTTVATDFEFNVTYLVNAYSAENSTSTYHVDYNDIPTWNLNYSFTEKNVVPTNWELLEFWFTYPNYHNATELDGPSGTQTVSETSIEGTVLDKVVISTPTDGDYNLSLASFNGVSGMQSYLNFDGTLWETRSFMIYDNISVSMDVQGPNTLAPIGGDANVSLFYPNGTKVTDIHSTNGEISEDNTVLTYDFNNNTIINLTDSIPLEDEFEGNDHYVLGFFWNNGSALGAKRIPIFIDQYDISVDELAFNEEIGQNVLTGNVKKVSNQFSYLVGTVNDITGSPYNPDTYFIENRDLNRQFSYEHGDNTFKVKLDYVLQNETILNPSEDFNLKISLQNLNDINLDTKVSAKVVSLTNEEWIITEATSNVATLNPKGFENNTDTYEFNVNLTMPSIQNGKWYGINGPVRQAGAKTIVTVYVEGEDVGTYQSPNQTLLTTESETDFEGNIIALKNIQDTTTNAILNVFDRDECLYSPQTTKILFNIYDQNYLSSNESLLNSFTLKQNTEFVNITRIPENPPYGITYNLTAVLTSEFDSLLQGKNVSLQYYFNNSWTHITSDLTDNEGIANLEIDSLDLNLNRSTLLRLTWDGDAKYMKTSKNFTTGLVMQNNQLSIRGPNEEVQIYRGKKAVISLVLTNTGNSTVKITNTSLSFNQSIDYSIVGFDNLELSDLKPGETTELRIQMTVPRNVPDDFSFNASINAQNKASNISFTTEKTLSVTVLDFPIEDFFTGIFPGVIIGAIAFSWLLSISYARKITKKIETPIQKAGKKGKPKGEYKKVSELEKPAKKAKKRGKKETEDLDSLLEKEGLSDEK